MPGSVLFIGDIHLGRQPSRIPADLTGEGLRAPALGPVTAWKRAVATAIAEGVDAVVLAGDVVDAENRLYEAYEPLDTGVQKLVAAGIRVYAVAGNHDGDVLPRMADEIEGFRLLGANGAWECVDLVPRGAATAAAAAATGAETETEDDTARAAGPKPFARLVGWSFPGARVTASPLAGFPRLAAADVPTFGVLHCDLDQPGSRYAPVARGELVATGLDGWFLGHVHVPSPFDGDRPIGYLGSLVGLDPGEPGAHGPVRVAIDGAGRVEIRRMPGGPLRWERVVVPLDEPGRELRRAEDLHARLLEALGDLRDRLGDDAGGAIAVGCRLILRGRTPAHRALRRLLDERSVETLRVQRDGVLLFTEKVIDEAQAPLDLATVAGQSTPPGRLARHLLALEADGPEANELIDAARRDLADVANGRHWTSLPAAELDRESVRALLLTTGRAALEELIAQNEDGGAS